MTTPLLNTLLQGTPGAASLLVDAARMEPQIASAAQRSFLAGGCSCGSGAAVAAARQTVAETIDSLCEALKEIKTALEGPKKKKKKGGFGGFLKKVAGGVGDVLSVADPVSLGTKIAKPLSKVLPGVGELLQGILGSAGALGSPPLSSGLLTDLRLVLDRAEADDYSLRSFLAGASERAGLALSLVPGTEATAWLSGIGSPVQNYVQGLFGMLGLMPSREETRTN